ncbi:MAG TPA: phosphatidylglycerol lysyltransferase domain-containing protein [Bdellovibrionota bacterium]|jgi:hypothetical protein
MGLISKEAAFAKFQKHGQNSSHFVWFLAGLEFFETSEGWIFAFRKQGKVTLFALEPIFPEDSSSFLLNVESCKRALAEMEQAIQPGISFFVSVYDPFLNILKELGYQSLQVGKEPYVKLADCIPTGKSGKGVRAARNQALRAGVKVEEWNKEKFEKHPERLEEMRTVLAEWQARNLVDLGEFLNKVNPFAHMDLRRYFLAYSPEGRFDGFLVATPIPGKRGYFLEDLVMRPGSSRGVGELLTLEAMTALAESGADVASLGVVSMTEIEDGHHLPSTMDLLLVTIPKFISKFYNVGGLETFRKRFKPHVWENISVALKNHSGQQSDTSAWIKALTALIVSFKPKFNFSWSWLWGTVSRPVLRYPVTSAAAAAFTSSFLFINGGGTLPDSVLRQLGFSGSAPAWQWPFRSVASDFLFFNFFHLASSVVLLCILIRWMERCYPSRFVAFTVIATSVLDDLINQCVLVTPYKYFQPKVFARLIEIKDVGPSLWLATFAGLQLCQLRRNREIAFAVLLVMVITSFALSSSHLSTLVLNLNHSLFLTFGYLLGKLRFEYEREVSRKVARQKPPVAKCVLPQRPKLHEARESQEKINA